VTKVSFHEERFPFPPCQDAEVVGAYVGDFMRVAVGRIDLLFGKGYAREHPELFGQFITAQMIRVAANAIGAVAQQIEDFPRPDEKIAQAINKAVTMFNRTQPTEND
jgi:hypothetical protein